MRKLTVKTIGEEHQFMILIDETKPINSLEVEYFFLDGSNAYRILFTEQPMDNIPLIPSNWRENSTETDALDWSNSYPIKDRDIAYESFLAGANSKEDTTYPKYVVMEEIREQYGDNVWVTPKLILRADGKFEGVIKEIIN